MRLFLYYLKLFYGYLRLFWGCSFLVYRIKVLYVLFDSMMVRNNFLNDLRLFCVENILEWDLDVVI